MRVDPTFHKGRQQVVRRVDVVVDGVDLVAVRLHRIGRGALFSEVDDGIRAIFGEPRLHAFVFAGKVEEMEVEPPTREIRARCGSAPESSPSG